MYIGTEIYLIQRLLLQMQCYWIRHLKLLTRQPSAGEIELVLGRTRLKDCAAFSTPGLHYGIRVSVKKEYAELLREAPNEMQTGFTAQSRQFGSNIVIFTQFQLF